MDTGIRTVIHAVRVTPALNAGRSMANMTLMKSEDVKKITEYSIHDRALADRTMELRERVPKRLADDLRERAVMKSMILAVLTACPAIIALTLIAILDLATLWYYFLLITCCLVFSILVLVEVFLLGRELGGRHNDNGYLGNDAGRS
jgi:hypothetical protein